MSGLEISRKKVKIYREVLTWSTQLQTQEKAGIWAFPKLPGAKAFWPILSFLSIARHSRIDDIEMIDKNERQEITVQEAHHGWCHNEK